MKRWYVGKGTFDLFVQVFGYTDALLLPPVRIGSEYIQVVLWEPDYEWSWY
jgi:hypothetical protein